MYKDQEAGNERQESPRSESSMEKIELRPLKLGLEGVGASVHEDEGARTEAMFRNRKDRT
jgi:hypothetical protein